MLEAVLPPLLWAGVLLLTHRIMQDAWQSQGIGQVWMRLLGNTQVTRGIAFVFGLAGVIYGLQQRNLRNSEAAYLKRRIGELESAMESEVRAGARNQQ